MYLQNRNGKCTCGAGKTSAKIKYPKSFYQDKVPYTVKIQSIVLIYYISTNKLTPIIFCLVFSFQKNTTFIGCSPERLFSKEKATINNRSSCWDHTPRENNQAKIQQLLQKLLHVIKKLKEKMEFGTTLYRDLPYNASMHKCNANYPM